MVHLTTLPAFKVTQNMVSKFAIFENRPTLDPNCAKTGPNTTPRFILISR